MPSKQHQAATLTHSTIPSRKTWLDKQLMAGGKQGLNLLVTFNLSSPRHFWSSTLGVTFTFK